MTARRLISIFYLLLIPGIVIAKECSPLLDIDVRRLNDNSMVNLCEHYQGKVILIVNTASKCAYTDQYDSLETMYRQYRDKGLVILGFPSNDFGHQEPGSEQQIQSFCRLTYGVEFPMFAKTRVTERNADELYQRLAKASGEYPRWNFHKYLLSVDGNLVSSYPSAIDPLDKRVVMQVEQELKRVKF
jgi:glutathione peroxidase